MAKVELKKTEFKRQVVGYLKGVADMYEEVAKSWPEESEDNNSHQYVADVLRVCLNDVLDENFEESVPAKEVK